MTDKVTVFTPTYNRAHTLHRVFDSLMSQSHTNFEWLLINDGSTDHTDEIVDTFKQKANFPIEYIKQENLHKFLTILKAIDLAKGQYFVTIDSDDGFDFDALEKMLKYWKEAPDDTVFISVLCKDKDGNIVGDPFPNSGFSTSIFDMRYKYKIKGDKWGMTKTDILKQIKTYVNQDRLLNKGFIPEGVYQFYYDLLGNHYGINEALRTYFHDVEDESSLANAYYDDKNSFGLAENYKTFLNVYAENKWKFPKVLFRNLIGYLLYSFKDKRTYRETTQALEDKLFKILAKFLYSFKLFTP